MEKKETTRKRSKKNIDSGDTEKSKDQKTENNELHDVIISVESRKGGVGKTTAALSAAKVLTGDGYAVLFLDCDITGTAIAECRKSPIWTKSMSILEEDGKEINLFQKFTTYFKDCDLNFLKRVMSTSSIDTILQEKKFLAISSNVNINDFTYYEIPHDLNELFQDVATNVLCNDLISQDFTHNSLFIDFLKEIVSHFHKEVNKLDKKHPVAVIIDNSPGYIGISPLIRNWLLTLGPKQGKFILVSGPDLQDVDATWQSIQSLLWTLNQNVHATHVLLEDFFGYSEKLNKILLAEDSDKHRAKIKDRVIDYIEQIDNQTAMKSFPECDYYLRILKNKTQQNVGMKDFYINIKDDFETDFKEKYSFIYVISNKHVSKRYSPINSNEFKKSFLPYIPIRRIINDTTLTHGFSAISASELEDQIKNNIRPYEDYTKILHFYPCFVPSRELTYRFLDSFFQSFKNFKSSLQHYGLTGDNDRITFETVESETISSNVFLSFLKSVNDLFKKHMHHDVYKELLSIVKNSNKDFTKKWLSIFCFYVIVVLNASDKDISNEDLRKYSVPFFAKLQSIDPNCIEVDKWIVLKKELEQLDKQIMKHQYLIRFIEEIRKLILTDWKMGKIHV